MLDTRDVRPGEELDWLRVIAWLRERLPGCAIPGLDVSREPEIAQFPGGHSNLTYRLRFGDADLVVRRPPIGPIAPTAHDMAREFRWLAAIADDRAAGDGRARRVAPRSSSTAAVACSRRSR